MQQRVGGCLFTLVGRLPVCLSPCLLDASPVASRTLKPEAAAAAAYPDPERIGKAGVPTARAARLHGPYLQPRRGPGAEQPADREPAPAKGEVRPQGLQAQLPKPRMGYFQRASKGRERTDRALHASRLLHEVMEEWGGERNGLLSGQGGAQPSWEGGNKGPGRGAGGEGAWPLHLLSNATLPHCARDQRQLIHWDHFRAGATET